jgi:CDP-diacylglycerol---glycerol-3-phosphate 3-phosphatidyltransferase
MERKLFSVIPMNWANFVTAIRIMLAPVFVYFMYAGGGRGFDSASKAGSVIAFVVFAVAAASDSLDGFLARRHNMVTRLGQFLDPAADKLLVGAALVTLVALRGFPLWAAVVIAFREVAVSLLRSLAMRRGGSLPASPSGKLKTAAQIPTVMLWLLARRGWVATVQDVSVYLAVAVTVASGIQYFARVRSILGPRDQAHTR